MGFQARDHQLRHLYESLSSEWTSDNGTLLSHIENAMPIISGFFEEEYTGLLQDILEFSEAQFPLLVSFLSTELE